MFIPRLRASSIFLIAGDLIVLTLVTVFGFTQHESLAASLPRLWTTLVPVWLAWLLVAPGLGALDVVRAADFRQLWRPFWAMVLAGPLAAWMRAVILGTVILPIFVVVLGGFCALAVLAWRSVYWLLISKKGVEYG